MAEATIGRSAQEVWAYAADILRHTEWMSVSSAKLISGDGSQVGARGVERLELGPMKRDVEFVVAESVPGERLLWRSDGAGDLSLEVELTLEPAGAAATTARYRGSYELRGRLRLLAPIMALEGGNGVKRELQQLKSRVEAASAATATSAEAIEQH